MIICSNCGAKFQESASECPYCGHIYMPGAEKEYIENLHEIREDMSEIEDLSEEIYRNEVRKNVKKTSVIIIVIVVFFLLLILGLAGISRLLSYDESEEEIKARMLWERENYPILDAWYEEGEYQTIVDFMEKTYEETDYSFYDWDHWQFIMQFENYQSCMDIGDRIAEGEELSEYDAGELLYCGMSIIDYDKESAYYLKEWYQESDLVILEQWKADVEKIFLNGLGYSAEELTELREKLYEDGYLSYDACSKYGKEFRKRTVKN